MKGSTIRKFVTSLTVVAFVLAGSTMSTVKVHKGEGAREENPPTRPTVQNERLATVDNIVETVETLVIYTPSPVVNIPAYTEEELEVLAIIIYQEAGGDACSDDTRRKVGSVFLNRVESPLFPDTFEEVALAKKQYGRLYWTGLKWPDRATKPEEAHAVDRAYRIAEELLMYGSILPDNVIWQAEFKQGDGTYCYQDHFYFCYSEVNK